MIKCSLSRDFSRFPINNIRGLLIIARRFYTVWSDGARGQGFPKEKMAEIAHKQKKACKCAGKVL